MKRSAALFLVLSVLLFSLFSCGNHPPASCRDVLAQITENETNLPAGKFYYLSATDSLDLLSSRLIASLYGDGIYPSVADEWIDCAVYLTYGESRVEFAVALCKSRYAAEDTAKLFLSRTALFDSDLSVAEGGDATVTVIGNYAMLTISKDTSGSIAVAKRAIRGY
jgi:hypothetical protein